MRREKKSWEEDPASELDEEQKLAAPPPVAPAPLQGKTTESSTLRIWEADRHDQDMNEKTKTKDMASDKKHANPEGGQNSSDGTTV